MKFMGKMDALICWVILIVGFITMFKVNIELDKILIKEWRICKERNMKNKNF